MISAILFVAFMAFLIKISNRNNKWWFWFIMIFGLLAKCGYQLNIFGLMIAVVLWKVFKDICNRGRLIIQ